MVEPTQDRADCLLEEVEQSATFTVGHGVVGVEGLVVGLLEQQVEISEGQQLTESVNITLMEPTSPLVHPSG